MRTMTKIRLKLDTLEARETPDGSVGAGGGDGFRDTGSVPAMAPQDPIIIEPDYHIILPPG